MALAVSGFSLTAIVVLAVTDANANAEAEAAELERLEQLQVAAALAEREARDAAAARAASETEAIEHAELAELVLGPPIPPAYVEVPAIDGLSLDRVSDLFEVEGLTLAATLDGEPLDLDDFDRYRVAASADLPKFVEAAATVVVPAERKPRPKYKKKYGRGY